MTEKNTPSVPSTDSSEQGFSLVERLGFLRPIVAIVGRPNVGKSTLFNRLIGSRASITDDLPGVTRDRLYEEIEWSGHRFTLVDTGGYVVGKSSAIDAAVRQQAQQAIAEADLVILLVDGQSGPTDLDSEVAAILRRGKRPTLLVVNKVDGEHRERSIDDFFGLGLGDPIPVSAVTGRKSGDLLDTVVTHCFVSDGDGQQEAPDEGVRIALSGRPNVGKSTLTNRLAGVSVSMVNERPGTTRDTTRVRLRWKDQDFILMDTAGIRRRTKVDDDVEYYSGLRASHSLDQADVVVALIDGVEGITSQDLRIIGMAVDAGCGVVITVNKWDLCEKGGQERGTLFRADAHDKHPFLADYPMMFISALTGQRVHRVLETIFRVQARRLKRVPTGPLNRFMEGLAPPQNSTPTGNAIRLRYATQQGVSPPSFVLFYNHTENIAASYKRYIEKNLRRQYDLEGTPIRIQVRRRREGPSREEEHKA